MALAVCHYDRITKRTVLDCVRERRPPFSPDDVVLEFTQCLRAFGIHRIVSDNYAGEWPRDRFKAHGIFVDPAPKTKNEAYIELLPMLNSGRVELLDHKRLIAQLCGLERHTARSGRDTITHAPRAHDDIINSVALACVSAVNSSQFRLEISDECLRNLARPRIPSAFFGY